MNRIHLIIHGNVQGVGFRWSAMREAQRLGLVGWVKNKSNGTVEIVAEGEEEALRELRAWLEKRPGGVIVERVEEEWKEIEIREYGEFKIVY